MVFMDFMYAAGRFLLPAANIRNVSLLIKIHNTL